MNSAFFDKTFEVLFNKQMSPNTKFLCAKDVLFICRRVLKCDEKKLGIGFNKTQFDFICEISKAIISGKNELEVANGLFVFEKYRIFQLPINEVRNTFYEDIHIEDMVKMIESMKQYIYIDSNIDTFSELVHMWKEGEFVSPENAVHRFHDDVQKIYTNSLKIQQSLQVSSNHLALFDLKNKKDMFIHQLTNFCTKENLLPSGFSGIDRHLEGGFEKNRLYMFAGTPGCGKSAIMLGCAKGFCEHLIKNKKQDDHFILYLTLENTWEETIIRMASNVLAQPYYNIKRIFNNVSKFEKASDMFFNTMATYPLIISYFESYSITPTDVISHINSIISKEKRQPAAIIIDYLDLVTVREQLEYRHVLGKIASAFKNISTRFKTPVITATQLTKASYTKEDHDLSDIGESAKKIDFSDVVFLLKKRSEAQIGITVAKNRCGPCGPFAMGYNGPFYRFTDLTNSEDNQKTDWGLERMDDGFIIDKVTNDEIKV